jgi:hypothetical protein
LITQLEMMTSTELSGSGNAFDLAFQEFDVLRARLALVFVGQRQHFVGHVEAVSFARRADAPGREQHIDAAARTEIEHGFAGLSCARAVGLPHPSEASIASSGICPACDASYRFEVIGSHESPLAGAAPQQLLPPLGNAQRGLSIFLFHDFLDVFNWRTSTSYRA